MIVYSILALLPYLLCQYVLITDSEMISRPCYRIMFFIGLADNLQLITNGLLGGLFMLTKNVLGISRIAKRVQSVSESSWMAYTILVNLLAFNRFVQICCTKKIDRIFTSRKTTVFLIGCWVYGGVWFVVYNTPYASTRTYFDSRHNLYFTGLSTWNWIELGLDVFQLICTLIWYVGVVVGLRVKAQQLFSPSDIHRHELNVLAQSFFLCLLYFCTCLGFFVVPLITSHVYAMFLSNLIWLMNSSFNPIIYLTFNKRLRKKIGNLIRMRRPIDVTPSDQTTPRVPSVVEDPVDLAVVRAPKIIIERTGPSGNPNKRIKWKDEVEAEERHTANRTMRMDSLV